MTLGSVEAPLSKLLALEGQRIWSISRALTLWLALSLQGKDTFNLASRVKEHVFTFRRFYGAGMAGVSIPATEHSTMTTWGRDGEGEAVRHVLEQVGEQAAVSVVADSYNVWNMLENVLGGKLKELVERRSGVLVVRPDSGEPREVVVKVLNILGEKFGHSTNKKGFRLLPPFLRVIQGDGISHDSLQDILTAVADSGWSLDNLVFGR